ncbi:MAG: hypothetical protein GTN97_07145 [Nitrosopumilaceae archaeon]|nr:hypothetical protein [Nitrosopumilaceae archaeon]
MTGEMPKAPLEEIFGGKSARIVDHLVTMRGFDYSIEELTEILNIRKDLVESIIKHLAQFGLVEVTSDRNIKKYRIARNERTELLNKFIFSVACYNIERVTGKKL